MQWERLERGNLKGSFCNHCRRGSPVEAEIQNFMFGVGRHILPHHCKCWEESLHYSFYEMERTMIGLTCANLKRERMSNFQRSTREHFLQPILDGLSADLAQGLEMSFTKQEVFQILGSPDPTKASVLRVSIVFH